MTKRQGLSLLLLALTIGAAQNLPTAASRQKNATSHVGVVQQRLMSLISDLSARGDTNTLAQVVALLAAKDSLQHTVHADMTIELLEHLREGQTDEAVSLLERKLDGAVIGIANYQKEMGPEQINTLKLAKEYRAKYPRRKDSSEIDAAVARAFKLLEQK